MRSTRSTTGEGAGAIPLRSSADACFEFGACLDQVLVRLGIFHQGGRGADFAREQVGGFGGKFRSLAEPCQRRRRAARGVDIPGRPGGGVAQFRAQVADFGHGMREQPRNLRFQGARVHDLAQGRVGRERQQVARHVEGPRLQGAVVGLRLHRLGAGDALAQGFVDGGGGALVGGEKVVDRIAVEFGGRGIGAEFGKVPAGFLEVLIARGALLPVPALLIHQHDGGQQAQALDGEGDVRQVGNGAMAVLEIECVEELLGALGADFGQRFAHGERRTRVLGHGIGQHFGVGSVNGIDIGLVAGAGGRKGSLDKDSLDMDEGSRPEYGIKEIGAVNPRDRKKRQRLQRGSKRQNAGVQIAHIAKAPAIAHRPLDHVSALERPSFCALARARGGSLAVSCRRDCSRTPFRGRRGSALCRFWMDRFSFRGVPSVPGTRSFPELHLRTYVHDQHTNTPGIYNLSVDIGSLLATAAVRLIFRLPCNWAEMRLNQRTEREFSFYSRRLFVSHPVDLQRALPGPGSHAEAGGDSRRHRSSISSPSAIACSRQNHAGQAVRANIHTVASPLEDAEAEIERNDLPAALGIQVTDQEPVLHYSRRLAVYVWPAELAVPARRRQRIPVQAMPSN